MAFKKSTKSLTALLSLLLLVAMLFSCAQQATVPPPTAETTPLQTPTNPPADTPTVQDPNAVYTVSFNLNFANATYTIAPQAVKYGQLATSPDVQARPGFKFKGWFIDKSCLNPFDFTKGIVSDVALYAGWVDESYSFDIAQKKAELDSIKELNNGVLPAIVLNEENSSPAFILGTFSEKAVTSFDSALASLSDVKNIMEFKDPENEYSDAGSTALDGLTQYRMQQMHAGVPVYGQQIIVTADDSGKTSSLSGDYAKISSAFNNETNLTLEQAIEAAEKVGFTIVEGDGEKVAYISNGYNEFAYVFSMGPETVIVSAVNGAILESFTNVFAALPATPGETTSTVGREYNTSTNTFNTVYYDYDDETLEDGYIFYDSERNIVYHDLKNETGSNWGFYYNTAPLWDEDNVWTSEGSGKAVDLYNNLSDVYDFYLNVLGLKSYDGNEGQILAFVNDSSSNGKNAFNWGPYEITEGINTTVLSFGGVANYQNDLDVVAHEFTHAVQRGLISALNYSGQTGALMEAYSDAMGELVQLYYSEDSSYTDWLIVDRNIADPNSSTNSNLNNMMYPKKYKGAGYDPRGEVHHNSTVISHAIYNIYEGGINDIGTLTELLFRSWGYLTPSATFYDYRMAMLAAAEDMALSEDSIAAIVDAFDFANITPDSIPEDYNNSDFFASVEVNYTILDQETSKPIEGAHVLVQMNNSEKTKVAEIFTDAEGKCSFKLNSGEYILTAFASIYESESTTCSFAYYETANMLVNLTKKIYQDDQVVCMFGGTVTDAVDGSALSDVTLKFRAGYNVTDGPVALTLTTGAEGEFRTDKLSYGFYTLEISKEGYITSSFIVQAAASNWEESLLEEALNQVFSISTSIMSDDTLRIVLTWDENPHDLDSHIWGYRADGSTYHVYYSNKIANEDGNKVAELDIDDTTSYGPETITVHITNTKEIYRYYVHDYSNRSDSYSTDMSNSGAKVQVYSGSTLVGTYKINLDRDATVWHVFDYNPKTGRITFVNDYTHESEPLSVGSLNTLSPEYSDEY